MSDKFYEKCFLVFCVSLEMTRHYSFVVFRKGSGLLILHRVPAQWRWALHKRRWLGLVILLLTKARHPEIWAQHYRLVADRAGPARGESWDLWGDSTLSTLYRGRGVGGDRAWHRPGPAPSGSAGRAGVTASTLCTCLQSCTILAFPSLSCKTFAARHQHTRNSDDHLNYLISE